AEHGVTALEAAVAFNEDLIVTVHKNVRDRRIAQEFLERTETEQLIEDVDNQVLPFGKAERSSLLLALEHADDQSAELRLSVRAPNLRQAIKVEPVQQLLMNPPLECLILGLPRVRLTGTRYERRRFQGSCPPDHERRPCVNRPRKPGRGCS